MTKLKAFIAMGFTNLYMSNSLIRLKIVKMKKVDLNNKQKIFF